MANPKISVETSRAPRLTGLAVPGLLILAATAAGLERAHQRLVQHMYRRGETKESLIRKIDRYPLPRGFKSLVGERVASADEALPACVEVESTVEDV